MCVTIVRENLSCRTRLESVPATKQDQYRMSQLPRSSTRYQSNPKLQSSPISFPRCSSKVEEKGKTVSYRDMEFFLKHITWFLCIMVLLPALCSSQYTYVSSRATYYGSPDCYGNPTGACGYGEYGRKVNDGHVSAVSRLYRNGTGCGACYQVRCKIPQHCSSDGVTTVVTDYGEGDRTDFIFSPRSYAKLADSPASSEVLFASGVVEIEYRRVPCTFSGYRLVFKVHEGSKYPYYFALVVQYVSGINDITAVEVWEEDRQRWRPMRRAYGAVWDLQNPPTGPLSIRFRIQRGSATAELDWMQATKVIPADWEAGAAYPSDIQLN